MPNGRCRMHGGLSTGPKTPKGLERSRRASWKHGRYSQESLAFGRRVRAFKVRGRILRQVWKCIGPYYEGEHLGAAQWQVVNDGLDLLDALKRSYDESFGLRGPVAE